MSSSTYHNWTREQLISRLEKLDSELAVVAHHQIPKKEDGSYFDFASHPRRKIALKFCYDGQGYNGMAFQKDITPLPTVEGVLFDALAQTRLIDPTKGFEGCGWERCGRTDRGVSAAGQVISLWVRSIIGKGTSSTTEPMRIESVQEPLEEAFDDLTDGLPLISNTGPSFSSRATPRSSISDIPYVQVLNRVLPSSLRVLAWSPVADTFSARFSCQFRHYKYFFPATGLSIARMQCAVERFVGSHDFRNFCTLDGSKQIVNYVRHISCAEISRVESNESKLDMDAMHVLDLAGNAFLYNQVRSIMAVLFLIGSGLEEPFVVSSLMNADSQNPLLPYRPGEPVQVVDRKPTYQMASALPLVLWDCGYLPEDVKWQTDDVPSTNNSSDSTVTNNVRHQLASIHIRSRIRSVIDDHFLRASSRYHEFPYTPLPFTNDKERNTALAGGKVMLNIPIGGGAHIRTSKHTPLLTRERGDSTDVVNERWRQGRGKKRLEKQKLQTK